MTASGVTAMHTPVPAASAGQRAAAKLFLSTPVRRPGFIRDAVTKEVTTRMCCVHGNCSHELVDSASGLACLQISVQTGSLAASQLARVARPCVELSV